jgi:dTDP-glucose pyrophosphorylase
VSVGDRPRETLAMILAGGQGERLYPLTKDRSKPSVPFGGLYRIIDFTLSNCVNSGLRRIYVLTQYKSSSLMRHIKLGWNIFSSEMGEFIHTIPPQLRVGAQWYQGTADALYQNIYQLELERPKRVLILSGDHIYRMDYAPMIEAHVQSGASVSIATALVDASECSRFGIVETDDANRVVGFEEKPAQPRRKPGPDGLVQVSMGIYIFNTDTLVRAVSEDAKRSTSHDFGRDIIPALIPAGGSTPSPFATPRARPATGATSGPSPPTTRPTWTSCTSRRSSTSTIQPSPADLRAPATPLEDGLRPGVRRRTPRDGARLPDLRRRDHQRRAHRAVDPLAVREDQLLREGRGLHPDGSGGDRASREGPASDHRQGRPRARGASRSATTGRRTHGASS